MFVVQVTNLLEDLHVFQAKFERLLEAEVGLGETLVISKEAKNGHQAPHFRVNVVKLVRLGDGVLCLMELAKSEQAQAEVDPTRSANSLLAALQEDGFGILPGLSSSVDDSKSLLEQRILKVWLEPEC